MPPRPLLMASAGVLAIAGLALVFAPGELLSVYGVVLPAPELALPQLLGAALLGNASLNWMARSAVLGGIYGRPVIHGNLTHCVVGALTLLRSALHGADRPAVWVTFGLYALFAAGFGALLYRRPIPPAPAD